MTALAVKVPREAALELSALFGRLPSARRYEPPIVTTLRRTFRRGAPESLMQRLAGGPAAWRQLNERWNLDGRAVDTRAPASVDLLEPLGAPLSIAERRIALLQLADECALEPRHFRGLPTAARGRLAAGRDRGRSSERRPGAARGREVLSRRLRRPAGAGAPVGPGVRFGSAAMTVVPAKRGDWCGEDLARAERWQPRARADAASEHSRRGRPAQGLDESGLA